MNILRTIQKSFDQTKSYSDSTREWSIVDTYEAQGKSFLKTKPNEAFDTNDDDFIDVLEPHEWLEKYVINQTKERLLVLETFNPGQIKINKEIQNQNTVTHEVFEDVIEFNDNNKEIVFDMLKSIERLSTSKNQINMINRVKESLKNDIEQFERIDFQDDFEFFALDDFYQDNKKNVKKSPPAKKNISKETIYKDHYIVNPNTSTLLKSSQIQAREENVSKEIYPISSKDFLTNYNSKTFFNILSDKLESISSFKIKHIELMNKLTNAIYQNTEYYTNSATKIAKNISGQIMSNGAHVFENISQQFTFENLFVKSMVKSLEELPAKSMFDTMITKLSSWWPFGSSGNHVHQLQPTIIHDKNIYEVDASKPLYNKDNAAKEIQNNLNKDSDELEIILEQFIACDDAKNDNYRSNKNFSEPNFDPSIIEQYNNEDFIEIVEDITGCDASSIVDLDFTTIDIEEETIGHDASLIVDDAF